MEDTVFQDVLKPITTKLLDECSKRFQSDYYYDTLKTHQHLQAMVYAHINEIKSLRVLAVAINSQNLGIKSKINRSTLSDANAARPADCFFWLLEQLMSLIPRKRYKEIDQVVRILDSSPIQLKGLGYDEWAKEFATSRCQGLKLHVEYDLAQKSPLKIVTSHPNYNDSSMGQRWPIAKNTIYVFDKGYCDFNWWWSIHQREAYFVTRLKKNVSIKMQTHNACNDETILEDGTFKFQNKKQHGKKRNVYTESLRRISVSRDGKNPLILATNLYHLSAEKIAELYKARWEIELFFKWIKQNLKLKKFFGKSHNAVKIQIVTALIAYLLVQIFKLKTKDTRTLQLVLTWVRYNLHATITPTKKQGTPDCRGSANWRAAYL